MANKGSTSRAKFKTVKLRDGKAEQTLINNFKKHNNQKWAHTFNSYYTMICNGLAHFDKYTANTLIEHRFKRGLFHIWSKKVLTDFRRIKMPKEISSYAHNILLTKCREWLDANHYRR